MANLESVVSVEPSMFFFFFTANKEVFSTQLQLFNKYKLNDKFLLKLRSDLVKTLRLIKQVILTKTVIIIKEH